MTSIEGRVPSIFAMLLWRVPSIIAMLLFVLIGANYVIVLIMHSKFWPNDFEYFELPASKPTQHTTAGKASLPSDLQLVISTLQARIDRLENDRREQKDPTEQPRRPPTQYSALPPQLLPTCESLMQSPNSPFADGAFLTRVSTHISWSPRADGSRELQLPLTCHLKRYTSFQALQCLKNRHLSMIGDSVSRYQFISLAYFIERGTYPARFGRTATPSHPCSHIDEDGNATCSLEPSVCMEGDFHWVANDPWKFFHSALGGSTDGGMFHGRFQCGCARGDGIGTPETTENALYVSLEGIKMSYISEVGWGETPDPVHGWNFTDCSKKGTCRSSTEDSDRLFARAKAHDWDWNEPLYQALNGTLPILLPDVDIAIYNRGHWGALTAERAETIMPLLHEWAGNDGRCFYRTTTASPKSNSLLREPETGYIKESTLKAGCGYLDFAHLTREFEFLPFAHPPPPMEENGKIWNYREREDIFWDFLHFMPWVYEELNNIMLNVLCNAMNVSEI
jgi:hypothetical protein